MCAGVHSQGELQSTALSRFVRFDRVCEVLVGGVMKSGVSQNEAEECGCVVFGVIIGSYVASYTGKVCLVYILGSDWESNVANISSIFRSRCAEAGGAMRAKPARRRRSTAT